jgi:hypothetical protein
MIISRKHAESNNKTFTIKPINDLVIKYVGDGKGWVDPFANDNSPAEFTNDINESTKANYHMEAEDFCKMLPAVYNGVLFDPPYSSRQISEHYKSAGLKAKAIDTSSHFYYRVINAIFNKIKVGGYAISFGWNTSGFSQKRGFSIIEILIVNHGAYHNDTLVTVEQKVQGMIPNAN